MEENDRTLIKKCDIYLAVVNYNVEGSMQEEIGPVVIISSDMSNKHTPVVTCLPITGRMEKKGLQIHVMVEGCGLEKKSIILTEQITLISKKNLREKIGSISHTVYEMELDKALKIHLNL